MEHWHLARVGGSCLVCLAGSLLAQTFHLSPRSTMTPDYGGVCRPYWSLLHAINDLRTGMVLEAIATAIGSPLIPIHCQTMLKTVWENAQANPPEWAEPEWAEREVTEYSKDREQFFADMADIVALLRDLGV